MSSGPDKQTGEVEKSDEELERERQVARQRQEEHSFRDVSAILTLRSTS